MGLNFSDAQSRKGGHELGCPRLSAHDMQRADAEASRWRADVMRGTATLERLAAADLEIILR